MIGIDRDHTIDTDYPVPFLNSTLNPAEPIFSRWVWVQPPDDEPYMIDVPPRGKTVAELEDLGDVDDIDALTDE